MEVLGGFSNREELGLMLDVTANLKKTSNRKRAKILKKKKKEKSRVQNTKEETVYDCVTSKN